MTLWFGVALMTAAAILIVLWPLRRDRATGRSGCEVAVYQDQLAEIARDRAAGLIGEVEAEAVRVEISRRLLAAADGDAALPPAGAATASPRRRRVVAVVALVGLPLGTCGTYLAIGSPKLPAQPLAARLDTPVQHRTIQAVVAQVEDHLDHNPDDGRGWRLVGPVYMSLGRFDDAARAVRNALRLAGDSSEGEADLGEALVAAANGVVTVEAAAAFDRALALDPHDAKAQFFVGLSAEQDGRRQQAAAVWREMLRGAPAGAPWVGLVRRSLARVAPDLVADESDQDPSRMAAAANLTSDPGSDMARAMVERLARRLEHEGSDVEGWLRLVRSYVVLGEQHKARMAVSDARRALAGDPDKVRRINELVEALGLDG